MGEARSMKDSRSALMEGLLRVVVEEDEVEVVMGQRAMSKEWLLEEVGYIVEEMEMRASVMVEGGSCEESEESEAETDCEDMSEACLAWETHARGGGCDSLGLADAVAFPPDLLADCDGDAPNDGLLKLPPTPPLCAIATGTDPRRSSATLAGKTMSAIKHSGVR